MEEDCKQPAPDCDFPDGCVGFDGVPGRKGTVPCYCIQVVDNHKGAHHCSHHVWNDEPAAEEKKDDYTTARSQLFNAVFLFGNVLIRGRPEESVAALKELRLSLDKFERVVRKDEFKRGRQDMQQEILLLLQ